MFDSVTHPRVRGRVGTGAVLSVALHVLALLIALWLTGKSDVPPPQVRTLLFPQLPHGGAPSAPAVASAAQAPAHPHRPHRRALLPDQPVVGQRMEPPDLAGVEGPDLGSALDVPGGVGSTVAGSAPTTVGGGVGTWVGSGPVDFSLERGMSLPHKLSGPNPAYTREALEAGVEGTIIARCTLSVQGEVTGCRILKGLPHLNRAVLEALGAQRYSPVMLDGHPIAVQYVFTIRMALPR